MLSFFRQQMQRAAICLLVSICFSVSVQVMAVDGKTTRAIKNLSSLNEDDVDHAVDLLVGMGPEGIEALYSQINKSVPSLLKDLGSDSFQERKYATETLISKGPQVKDAVTNLMQQTNDPEVRTRCKKILANLKQAKGSSHIQRAIDNAILVVIKLQQPPPKAAGILNNYLKRYPKLPARLQKQWPEVVKKAVTLPTLAPDLVQFLGNFKDDAEFAKAKATLLALAPSLKGVIEEAEFQRNLEAFDCSKATDIINDATQKTSGPRQYTKAAEAIRKLPDFNEAMYIHKLLASKREKDKNVALYLAAKNLEKYVSTIVAHARRTPPRGDDEWSSWSLKHLPDAKKHFAPFAKDFLNSSARESVEFGLFLIEDEVDKHRPLLLEILANPAAAGRNAICQFVMAHDKKNVTQYQQVLIKQILNVPKFKDLKDRGFLLGGILKYKGKELHKWWQEKCEPEYKQGKKLDVYLADYLNIPPELIAPYVTQDSFTTGNVEYIYDCNEKLHDKLDEQLTKCITKEPSSAYSVLAYTGQRKPNEERFFKFLFITLDSIKAKHSGKTNSSIIYALQNCKLPLIKNKQYEEKLLAYLSGKDVAPKFYAGMTLFILSNQQDALRKHLPDLIASIEQHDAQKILATMLGNCNAPAKPILKILTEIMDQETPQYALREVLGAIPNTRKDLIPGLTKLLAQADDNGFMGIDKDGDDDDDDDDGWGDDDDDDDDDLLKEHGYYAQRAIPIADKLLFLDKDNKEATAALLLIVEKCRDISMAWKAFEALCEHRLEPQLSKERLETMYTQCDGFYTPNNALGECTKNLDKVQDIIMANLTKQAESSTSNGLDDLLWNNHALRQPLTPPLVKLLSSDKVDTRDFAVSTLSGPTDYLHEHIPELKASLKKFTKPGNIRTFSWMCANMGQKATPLYDDLMKKQYQSPEGKDIPYAYFLTARCHPDRAKRREATLAFIDYIKKAEPDQYWRLFRMLGLVRDFNDEVQSFFREQVLNQKTKGRGEALWGLQRVEPLTPLARKTYLDLIKRAVENESGRDTEMDTVMRQLPEHLDFAKEALPLVKKIPTRQRPGNFWRCITLTERKLKEDKAK